MRRTRCLLVAVVLLAVPHGARAEPPPPEAGARLDTLRAQQAALIRPLLTSGDDRQVAWGATWARELSLGELEPDLVQLLRDEAQDEEVVGYYGMLAVFDALIHLGAVVEVEALRPFLERRHGYGRDHAAAVLILAIRSKNPHALLDLFNVLERDEKSWEEGWLALGNALVEERPPGLAALLIEGIEIDVDVTVHDPGRSIGIGRSIAVGSADGRLPERKGYPRVWRHDLTVRPRVGDMLLADGPRPVYLRRQEALRGFGRTRSTADRSRERIAWIALLLGRELDDLPLQRRYVHSVEWSTAGDYVASVQGRQLRIASDFAQVVQHLVAAGHLTEREASRLVPRMNVTVRDARENASVPLPPLPEQAR